MGVTPRESVLSMQVFAALATVSGFTLCRLAPDYGSGSVRMLERRTTHGPLLSNSSQSRV